MFPELACVAAAQDVLGAAAVRFGGGRGRPPLPAGSSPAPLSGARRRLTHLSGTGLAYTLEMPDQVNRYTTGVRRGWLIVGLSLAVLFALALLKGRADAGGDLD